MKYFIDKSYRDRLTSPSTRREWIEIRRYGGEKGRRRRLPPHGGSGLKYTDCGAKFISIQSPSTRREWIEIPWRGQRIPAILSPSTRREWIEIALGQAIGYALGLPPHGGSGLKFHV